MSTTKESITAALKKAGYNARQVSVRNRHAGYSSSLIITIRDPTVNYDVVKQIGIDHKHVDYDQHSGEILSGGNTYIDTYFTNEVREIWAIKFLPSINEAISRLSEENTGGRIDDRFTIFKADWNYYTIWDEYDSWLPRKYSNPVDIAVELYIRATYTVSKVTQTAVERYWLQVFRGNGESWKDSAGEYSTTAMGEEAAIHFRCSSDQGNTDIEQQIFDWAIIFAERLPKAA